VCEAEELLRFISRDQHDRVTRREPRGDVSGGLFHVLGQPVELPVVIEESPERGQIPAPRLTYVNHGSRPLKIPSPDSTLYLQSAGDGGAGSRPSRPRWQERRSPFGRGVLARATLWLTERALPKRAGRPCPAQGELRAWPAS
jgi:hypothetical protein